jgi:type II secretion system protein D
LFQAAAPFEFRIARQADQETTAVNRIRFSNGRMIACSALIGLLTAWPALAQEGRPSPLPTNGPGNAANDTAAETPAQPPPFNGDRPSTAAQPAASDVPDEIDASTGQRTNGTRRPPPTDSMVTALAFNDVAVGEVIPFIMQATGKVVIPVNLTTLNTKKITLVNDAPVTWGQALDLVIKALHLNGVGVIERDNLVVLADINDVTTNALEVLPATEDIMDRADIGTIVVKIFALKYAAADALVEQIEPMLPSYAVAGTEPNSNQLILLANIDTAQQVQKLIRSIDIPGIGAQTITLRLRHANAGDIAQNILDLFEGLEETQAGAGGAANQRNQRAAAAQRNAQAGERQRAAQAAAGGATTNAQSAPPIELRVTSNLQQNAVTVSGSPETIDQIKNLVLELDRPPSVDAIRAYNLRYTDPIRVRDLLVAMLGGGSQSSSLGGAGGGARAGGAAGQVGRRTANAPGGGGDVQQTVAGIYTIEVYPDSNRLVVITKSEKNFPFLEALLDSIDTPLEPNLPMVVSLKHANAEELADQLNALLAEAGAQVDIFRQGEGLNLELSGTFDDASATGGSAGGGGGSSTTSGQEDAGTISFPWQSGGAGDDQTPASSLIGKVRIVPIHRQNAVAVLAPPEIRDAVARIVEQDFDKPGRQVLISAILVEVELNDELALGVRLSSSDSILNLTNPDFGIAGGLSATGTEDGIFGSLFDTSTLDANVSVNFVIQALNQVTKVRILQEPRIFTADNQEALFFDGQDIPFITDSQSTDVGTLNQSFEYRAVGVVLNVRPRITSQRDVAMEINVELSNIVPGQTLFGGFIVDRRETTSSVIIKNGQTIILSGILKDEETQIKRKVPILGDIPGLDYVFSSRENSNRRSELIAFITPTVVDNPSENDTNFNAAERRFLKLLSRPIDEQVKDLQNREGVYQHRRPGHLETTPQLQETEIDLDAAEHATEEELIERGMEQDPGHGVIDP